MKIERFMLIAVVAAAVACTLGSSFARAQEKPDYLSPAEADKVRDAQDPNDRIKLFVSFAGDRLKKVEYELHLTSPQYHKEKFVNGLLEAYSNCMDEVSDRIDEGKQSGAQIRSALKDMQKRGKEYLQTLKSIEEKNGPEVTAYKDSLDDAIDGTQDALKEAAKASKEYGSTPIRRKP